MTISRKEVRDSTNEMKAEITGLHTKINAVSEETEKIKQVVNVNIEKSEHRFQRMESRLEEDRQGKYKPSKAEKKKGHNRKSNCGQSCT